MDPKPQSWTPEQWSLILYYTSIAKQPRPMPGRSLTANGAARFAVRRLQETALQAEIQTARRA